MAASHDTSAGTAAGASGPPAPDAAEVMRSRMFVAVLALAAVVGVLVSLAAWAFLQGTHQLQVALFEELPDAVGYDDGAPLWWYFPALGLGGVLAALAIARLPGRGGHVPAYGLQAGSPTAPIELPGVVLAAAATLSFGLVLGPEAPLIALGGGLGVLFVRRLRRDAAPELAQLIAAAGSFAAVSFIFDSPLIAAVLLIEATGLGGPRRALVVVPGLLAAGIGSLVSIGLGSFTGLSTSDYALGAVALPEYARPDLAALGWTIPLAAALALFALGVLLIGRRLVPLATRRPFLVTPVVGLLVAGLAVLFTQVSDKGPEQVLFSGQDQLGGMVAGASTWSTSALVLVLVLKGVAWGLSAGSFRGGPTFPALFLGAAAGILAADLLPGLDLAPAVAVGMGATTVAVLRLPLSAVLLAVVLTSDAGVGSTPLIIVGVIVAYLVVNLVQPATAAPEAEGAPADDHAGRVRA